MKLAIALLARLSRSTEAKDGGFFSKYFLILTVAAVDRKLFTTQYRAKPDGTLNEK